MLWSDTWQGFPEGKKVPTSNADFPALDEISFVISIFNNRTRERTSPLVSLFDQIGAC